jgi:hypothetical protein
MTNALMRKVFRKEISRAKAIAALRMIEDDVKQGLLRKLAVDWDAVFQRAGELSLLNSGKLGCRSMDILHVSCALVLGYPRFFTLDASQEALAGRAGLQILNS